MQQRIQNQGSWEGGKRERREVEEGEEEGREGRRERERGEREGGKEEHSADVHQHA